MLPSHLSLALRCRAHRHGPSFARIRYLPRVPGLTRESGLITLFGSRRMLAVVYSGLWNPFWIDQGPSSGVSTCMDGCLRRQSQGWCDATARAQAIRPCLALHRGCRTCHWINQLLVMQASLPCVHGWLASALVLPCPSRCVVSRCFRALHRECMARQARDPPLGD